MENIIQSGTHNIPAYIRWGDINKWGGFNNSIVWLFGWNFYIHGTTVGYEYGRTLTFNATQEATLII